jgi:hypothetical protein
VHGLGEGGFHACAEAGGEDDCGSFRLGHVPSYAAGAAWVKPGLYHV